MTVKVDLNCDMGESFGLYTIGNDDDMLNYVTTANIGCGFHGGDPHIINHTIQQAKKRGVEIGGHPGFPDLIGFGRRRITCTPKEIHDYVIYQMGALIAFAKINEKKVVHCKPHGALYMAAMEEESVAEVIVEGIARLDETLILMATNNSALGYVGQKKGLRVAYEVFADREHSSNGSIVLTRKGPEVTDPQQLAQRVLRMVTEGKVKTVDGHDINIRADTVCIHGDNPVAPKLAETIKECLLKAGVQVVPISKVV
jgi:UPF0271 protein